MLSPSCDSSFVVCRRHVHETMFTCTHVRAQSEISRKGNRSPSTSTLPIAFRCSVCTGKKRNEGEKGKDAGKEAKNKTPGRIIWTDAQIRYCRDRQAGNWKNATRIERRG
mmetsp:Transcript_29405/g.57728  ORF Transcript_29405/g.57728 Transcript_29405/m.57728 type:complete len:110 (+) Transcript_29405:263-592(+)